ncbi:hypothetical protein ACFL3F_04805 [Planctomycetota bacterium]
MDKNPNKLAWQGSIVSIQPRIRLLRSFDQRQHSYLGYVLCIQGAIGTKIKMFLIGIGKGAQAKHEFRVGDVVSGLSLPVADQRIETVEYYKTSALKLLERPEVEEKDPPPWMGLSPELTTYRARGHRRLDARTYEKSCQDCMWGCKMAVEMIIDQWNPSKKRYRYETFCYGPKSCTFYKAGPNRKVPGRKGMTWIEEDWVDEDATAHRGVDE